MIVTATIHQALHVALNMREWDRREVLALRRDDDLVAWMHECLDMPGMQAWIGLTKDQEPAAIGGVAPCYAADGEQTDIFVVWLVGTNRLPEVGVQAHRQCQRVQQTLIDAGARRFIAVSMDGHDDGRRWLARMGYANHGQTPMRGRNGETFSLMVREVQHV